MRPNVKEMPENSYYGWCDIYIYIHKSIKPLSYDHLKSPLFFRVPRVLALALVSQQSLLKLAWLGLISVTSNLSISLICDLHSGVMLSSNHVGFCCVVLGLKRCDCVIVTLWLDVLDNIRCHRHSKFSCREMIPLSSCLFSSSCLPWWK